MDNIQHCVQTVLDDDVPGDLIETGVWRGGACIFMKANLEAWGDTTRTCLGGRLVPGAAAAERRRLPGRRGRHAAHAEPASRSAPTRCAHNFERYGLLDDRVRVPRRLVQGHAADRADRALVGDAARRRHVRVDDPGDRARSTRSSRRAASASSTTSAATPRRPARRCTTTARSTGSPTRSSRSTSSAPTGARPEAHSSELAERGSRRLPTAGRPRRHRPTGKPAPEHVAHLVGASPLA